MGSHFPLYFSSTSMLSASALGVKKAHKSIFFNTMVVKSELVAEVVKDVLLWKRWMKTLLLQNAASRLPTHFLFFWTGWRRLDTVHTTAGTRPQLTGQRDTKDTITHNNRRKYAIRLYNMSQITFNNNNNPKLYSSIPGILKVDFFFSPFFSYSRSKATIFSCYIIKHYPVLSRQLNCISYI